MSTADLTKATRELFVRSLVDQVYYRTPFIEELQRRRQITHTAGKYIERLIDTDEIDDLMQVYTANSALTDAKKTTLEKPRFTWRLWQLPLRYDVDEELQNVHGGKEITLLNLAKHLVTKGQRACKLWLDKQVFNNGSTTGIADGTVTSLQSLVSGLDHDVTYGTISRTWSTGTNDYWQGADPSGLNESVSTSGQGTAYNLTKANIRKWVNETDVAHHMEGADDLMILMCPTLWNKLAAQFEAHLEYKPGSKQSQGIRSMIFDGHEIVSVPYLQTTSTMKTWLFILNLRHWELRIHSMRNMKMTDFKWQGENANGYDYHLARILGQGNLVCWKPNSSMWLSNVS
jgi:hypothetical protein